MSKNHPNDNMYSILGKLEALKPKAETPKETAQKIYESVEAQGSVKKGLESVLAEKYMGFKKLEKSIAAKGDVKDAGAVAASIGRNKYGKGKFQKAAAAGKHMGETENNDDQDVMGYLNKELADYDKSQEEGVAEVAPPGAKAERMVKGIKKSLSKDGHLSAKDKAIAYATTWKAHNKGQVEETGLDKHSTSALKSATGKDRTADWASGVPANFSTAQLKAELAKRSNVEEAYNPVKAVKQCAKDYMEMNGIASVRDLEAEDIESIGGDCQMNYQDVCEILGCNLPDSLGPVKSWDTDEHGNKFDLEEGVCNECGMMEGSCEHTMREGETTHKGGEKVSTAKGTIHKSKATVDTEKELSRGDVPDLDKDDDAPVSTEKKGRGRPKMADKDRSQASLPWGGKPPKVDANPTKKWPKEKTRVHKMSESKLSERFAALSESRLMDSAGETLQHVLNRFRAEVRHFEQGGDLDKDLYDALYDYYVESGEMPYGVAKARTGDPMNWVAERLDVELGNHAYGSDPANAEDYGMEREGIGQDLVTPQQRVAQSTPQKPGLMGAIKDVAKGAKDWIQGKPETGPTYEEANPMEQELNELARLAGLNVQETKKPDADKDGIPNWADKNPTTAGDDSDRKDEEIEQEGNAFGKAVRDAKADGVQSGEKVKVGNKEYPVKEATTLEDIARLSGIAIEGKDYGDTKVEPAPEYENTPDEEIESEEVLTKGGDGEVAGKEKKMSKQGSARFSDNPMESLSNKLLAAYESIKIQK